MTTTRHPTNTVTTATITRRKRMAAFVPNKRGSINNGWKDTTTTKTAPCLLLPLPHNPSSMIKSAPPLLFLSSMMQSSMTSVIPLNNRLRGRRDVIFNGGINAIQHQQREQQQRQRRSSLWSNTATRSLSLFSSATSTNNGRMTKTIGPKTATKSVTKATPPVTSTKVTTLFDEIRTLLRVLLPSIISGLIATLSFTWLCQQITTTTLVIQSSLSSSLVSSATTSATATFVNLIGLLYSILLGQLYSFLYTQQESLYYALYDEVTEAKSLLEQVGLLASGRVMYRTCLESISRYVKEDLLGGTTTTKSATSTSTTSRSVATPILSDSPSILLSARPIDDPLESILYLTSVGVPSQLYDTVRCLRQARSRRLGALQRKVPILHLILISLLGGIMLASFPISVGVECASSIIATTAATTARRGGNVVVKSIINNRGGIGVGIGIVVTMQSMLFGIATFAVVLSKMVLIELWRMKSRGAYSVDKVLRVMVRGLQCELDERMVDATTQPSTNNNSNNNDDNN